MGRLTDRTGFERLRPVTVATTPEMIADQIRELIRDGSLAPGTALTESRLASQLLVSRGPVREALQRLVQEGLLQNERYRGVFVSRLTTQDIIDIYDARIVIEGAALRALVAQRPDRRLLQRLERLIAEMAKAAEQENWVVLTATDLRFHETLVDASRSKRLSRMYATLMVESGMCLAMLKPAYSDFRSLVDEHMELLAALSSADSEHVMSLIEAHLHDAVQSLVALSDHNGAH
jgi:DNA-binding GntR family transcriptional regulator